MFPETRWTMLARATLNGDDAGRAALEELCRRYWPAVRDFLKARGVSAEEAEDVTQDFFAGLVKSGGWHHADRARGKFRSFLLGGLERTLSERRRRSHAQKRGGGVVPVPLDALTQGGPAVEPDGDREFDAVWAERVLEVAMDALEREFAEQGKAEAFGALVPFLSNSAGIDASRGAAASLGISEGALKTKIFRLRQRFRDCILAEVSRTVETPHEAEQEMRYLFQILSHPGTAMPQAGETGSREFPENTP